MVEVGINTIQFRDPTTQAIICNENPGVVNAASNIEKTNEVRLQDVSDDEDLHGLLKATCVPAPAPSFGPLGLVVYAVLFIVAGVLSPRRPSSRR